MPRLAATLVSLCLALTATTSALADDAPAPPPPVPPSFDKLRLSLERIGGYVATKARPEDGDEISATGVMLGGPAHSPASAPRLALDYVLPSRITLGGAVAFGTASVKTDDDSEYKASFFLLAPRVGYLISAGPSVDLHLRGGVTLLQGTFQEPTYRSCSFNGTTTTCSKRDGDELSGKATMATLEGVLAYKLTSSFHLLGGLSVDTLLSASGEKKEDKSSGTKTESDDYKGSGSNVHLWFGLGGSF